MALGHNIKHLMDVTHASYSDIAKACDTDPQAIQALVKRDSGRSNFAPGIASYFKIPLDILISGDEEKIDQFLTASHVAEQSPKYLTPTNWDLQRTDSLKYLPAIPVTHTLITGSGEYSKMQLLTGGGQILWPMVTRDAYGLKVQGDHLAPRVRHGEYLLVDPHADYNPGDEVAAQLSREDSVFIGVFLYKRDGMYYFEDVNQSGRKAQISESEIKHIHLIAGHAKSQLHRY